QAEAQEVGNGQSQPEPAALPVGKPGGGRAHQAAPEAQPFPPAPLRHWLTRRSPFPAAPDRPSERLELRVVVFPRRIHRALHRAEPLDRREPAVDVRFLAVVIAGDDLRVAAPREPAEALRLIAPVEDRDVAADPFPPALQRTF